MFKLIKSDQKDIHIRMSEMQPLDMGVIVGQGTNKNIGDIVMRTASTAKFEVFNILHPHRDECWTNNNCPVNIRLLPPGTKLILEVI